MVTSKMMEESKEELEYTPEDVIIISDQKSLIETLIKNVRNFSIIC